MNDSDEFGVLRWPLKEIAQAIGAHAKLLKELADKQVLKGGDAGCEAFIYTPKHARKLGEPVELIKKTSRPCWFSSRMVTDEWRRSVQGAGTRFTSPNDAPTPRVGEDQGEAPNHAPNPRPSDGATSPSTPSVIPIPSVAKATATEVAPTDPVLQVGPGDHGDGWPNGQQSPELTKAELWSAGKSLLAAQGVPAAQCGSFVGGLVKEYGDAIVIEAVRAAVLTTPADAKEYLKGACKRLSGERKNAEPEWRVEQRNRTLQAVPNIADCSHVPPTQFFESEVTNVLAIAVG